MIVKIWHTVRHTGGKLSKIKTSIDAASWVARTRTMGGFFIKKTFVPWNSVTWIEFDYPAGY